jgi:hypothetical protein
VVRRLAIAAMVLGLAVAIIGGWPGRRVARDEAGCFTQDLVAIPHHFADRANPARVLLPIPLDESRCAAKLVEVVRPAAGPALRILAAFLALLAGFAAAGYARIAVPLITTAGVAGAVIVFVVTRSLDAPTDETIYLWPRLAVQLCTGGLTAALVALAVAWLLVSVPRSPVLPSARALR